MFRRAAFDGAVVFDGLEPGIVIAWAGLPGVGVAAARALDLGSVRAGELVLEPYADLSGTVVGPDGPVPGARVGMQHMERNAYWKLVSEGDGTFAFEPLSAGEYRLFVSGSRCGAWGVDEVELQLLEDGAPLRYLGHAELLVLDPSSVEHARHSASD